MNDWKKLLINAEASIRDAMRIIDIGSEKTAFVVNDDNELMGSISDGDIRRGLLLDSNMDDEIKNIINLNPTVGNINQTKNELKKILLDLDIQCIPLLDKRTVVGAVSLRSLLQYPKRDNAVFLMAGGFGTRLRPLTDTCPKPMLPVGDKPMLERLILQLSKQGFSNFFISTHYLPNIIREYFLDGSKWSVNIQYVHEESPLGTGGALGLLPKSIPDLPVIVLNGDVLTDLDFTKLLDFQEAQGMDAVMCVREIEHQISYGVVETEGHLITGMREKPTYQHDINTGIYVIGREHVHNLPKGERIDMPSYLDLLMKKGLKVGVLRHQGYWLDIGRMADYQKAQRDILEFFN